MLCANAGTDWNGFNGERGWYLLGAMRIAWIMEAGEGLHEIPAQYRKRARAHAHIQGGYLGDGQRIFIADRKRSKLFERAVDLGARSRSGLIYRAFRTKTGAPLTLGDSLLGTLLCGRIGVSSTSRMPKIGAARDGSPLLFVSATPSSC